MTPDIGRPFGIYPRTLRMPKFWHTYVITCGDFVLIVEPVNKLDPTERRTRHRKSGILSYLPVWPTFFVFNLALLYPSDPKPIKGRNLTPDQARLLRTIKDLVCL